MPEAARLSDEGFTRASSSPSAWAPTQSSAAAAQPFSGQAATRNSGRASAITTAPAAGASQRCRSG